MRALVKPACPVPGVCSAELEGAQGAVSIGTGLNETAVGVDTQRRVRINGTSGERPVTNLLDHSRIVWLTPAMDGLFTGPAGERRKFLDRLVLAIDPAARPPGTGFRKGDARSQQIAEREDTTHAQWLDAVEDANGGTGHSDCGCPDGAGLPAFVDDREDTMIRLRPFPMPFWPLRGRSKPPMVTWRRAIWKVNMATGCGPAAGSDKGAGRTLEGPHRSDLKISHGPKSWLPRFVRPGSKKRFWWAWCWPMRGLTGEMNGFPPILLLDEIAAHLDASRRAALFDMIEDLGCQSFMTGTDAQLFDAMGKRGNFFSVADGKVSPCP